MQIKAENTAETCVREFLEEIPSVEMQEIPDRFEESCVTCTLVIRDLRWMQTGIVCPVLNCFGKSSSTTRRIFTPFLNRKAGNNIDLSPAPGPEDVDAAENSYLEVIMYAVNYDGLTTTVSRDIMPQLASLQIDTDPSGLQVLISGSPVTTRKTIFSGENHELGLIVEDQPPYSFTSWSNLVDSGHR